MRPTDVYFEACKKFGRMFGRTFGRTFGRMFGRGFDGAFGRALGRGSMGSLTCNMIGRLIGS